MRYWLRLSLLAAAICGRTEELRAQSPALNAANGPPSDLLAMQTGFVETESPAFATITQSDIAAKVKLAKENLAKKDQDVIRSSGNGQSLNSGERTLFVRRQSRWFENICILPAPRWRA